MTMQVSTETSRFRTSATRPTVAAQHDARIAWVDFAKGWTILLVVLMHATLGVGKQLETTGWTHVIVQFAKPFRMPDFFLVAGLFAGSAVALPWRSFLDRRVAHFAYFYLLWMTVLVAVRGVGGPLGEALDQWFGALVDPYSSLWFIYVLPAMFLTVRLAHRLPRLLVLAAAFGLHLVAAAHEDGGAYMMAATLTGNTAVDSYALFTVFFLIGHYARALIFALANFARSRPLAALALLAPWAVLNGLATSQNWLDIPGAIFGFGLAGALAVVVLAALLSRIPLFGWLAVLGRNSLAIYLAYALPLAAARAILIRLDLIDDAGMVATIATLAGLVLPLVLAKAGPRLGLGFLFTRPAWARIEARERA